MNSLQKQTKSPNPTNKNTHTHTSLENFWKNSINVLYAQIYCKFICDPLPTCNRQLKVWRVKFKQTFTQADKLTNILTANRPSWLLDVFCLQTSPDAKYNQITFFFPLMKHQRIKHTASKAKQNTETQPWNSSDTSGKHKTSKAQHLSAVYDHAKLIWMPPMQAKYRQSHGGSQ